MRIVININHELHVEYHGNKKNNAAINIKVHSILEDTSIQRKKEALATSIYLRKRRDGNSSHQKEHARVE